MGLWLLVVGQHNTSKSCSKLMLLVPVLPLSLFNASVAHVLTSSLRVYVCVCWCASYGWLHQLGTMTRVLNKGYQDVRCCVRTNKGFVSGSSDDCLLCLSANKHTILFAASIPSKIWQFSYLGFCENLFKKNFLLAFDCKTSCRFNLLKFVVWLLFYCVFFNKFTGSSTLSSNKN